MQDQRSPRGAATRSLVDPDIVMLAAYLDAHGDDVEAAACDWSRLKAEVDAQLERDLEAARSWKPKVTIEPLSPAERQRLHQLLADGLAEKPTVGAPRRRDDATKGPRYALAALEREADVVRFAPVGLRNQMLAASAWTLARPELAGLLDAATVEDVLVEAARDAGLPEREARPTVRRALRKRGVS